MIEISAPLSFTSVDCQIRQTVLENKAQDLYLADQIRNRYVACEFVNDWSCLPAQENKTQDTHFADPRRTNMLRIPPPVARNGAKN